MTTSLVEPNYIRLGFAGTGYRLLAPTFFNLGMPVLVLDYGLVDPAARMLLSSFSRRTPPLVAELIFDMRGKDLCIWHEQIQKGDRAHVGEGYCVARLPVSHSISAASIVLIVCKTWLVDQTWAHLWPDHLVGTIGRDSGDRLACRSSR